MSQQKLNYKVMWAELQECLGEICDEQALELMAGIETAFKRGEAE